MDKEKQSGAFALHKNKKILFVIVGLQVLVLGITMYVFLSGKSGESASAVSRDNDSFPFIPIWAAVFIPVIAAMNKKSAEKLKSSKWYYTFLLGFAAFILAVMLIFLIRVFK